MWRSQYKNSLVRIHQFEEGFKYIGYSESLSTELEVIAPCYSDGNNHFSKDIFTFFTKNLRPGIESHEKGGSNFNIEPTEILIEKIYIRRGYDYLDICQENERFAEEMEYYRNSNEEFSDDESAPGDSSFCTSCQNSPCICSDREKTSSTHDF